MESITTMIEPQIDDYLTTIFGKKKRSKKKIHGSPKDIKKEEHYSYEYLLNRLYSQLNSTKKSNNKTKSNVNIKIPIPIVAKAGRRVAFINFVPVCETLNRSVQHAMSYFIAELSTTANLDGGGRLIFRSNVTQKDIEGIIRSYVKNYVQCNTCKSLNTELIKENRITFIKCNMCNSKRSVVQIKSGFKTTTRADRLAERAVPKRLAERAVPKRLAERTVPSGLTEKKE